MPDLDPKRVYELFVLVREFSPEERETFLREACKDQPEVGRFVEELCSEGSRKLDFLEGANGTAGAPADGAVSPPPSHGLTESQIDGQPIFEHPQAGPYKLLEAIGEGGMGIVYLAEQTEPVRRRVAVKVIKPGMDSGQVIARFEAERQALAIMDHPNIARVLDVGTTESGRPYFAMDLVCGISITEYCDVNKLDQATRLRLFRDVCSAVHHAHQKGVIHRDIKPSNVLVTEQDGEPVVKVIDFGMAKALSQRLTEKTLFTGLFQMIGTPRYMSPEQATLSNVDVDTRSDIYSLGVLLYELLAGTLPFDRETTEKQGLEAYCRLIREVEPPRPSHRVSTLDEEERVTISGCRQLGQYHLAQSLRGELDWIVMKALEKDRARRYQSAREFADDVRRYLAAEPVQAGPPSKAYHVAKFARRHRAALASVFLILLTLLAGLSIATWQAFRATRAERESAANLEVANRRGRSLSHLLYASEMAAATDHFLEGDFRRLRNVLRRHAPANADDEDLRGFEWYLLNNQRAPSTERVFQASERVDVLILHPAGRLLFVGQSDSTITVIDTEHWQPLIEQSSPHRGVQDICFMGGNRLASCGNDGAVGLWDLEITPKAGRTPNPIPHEDTRAPSAHVAAQDSEQVRLQLVQQIQVSEKQLYALAYSEFEEALYTAGEDRQVHRIDLNTSSAKAIFKPFDERIETMASLAGGGVLVGVYDGVLAYFPPRESEPSWLYDRTSFMDGFKDLSSNLRFGGVLAGQLGGQVTLLDCRSQPEVRFSQLLPADVHSVAMDAMQLWMAAGDSAGRLHVLPVRVQLGAGYLDNEAARRRRMQTWKAHDTKVEQVLFLPANADGAARGVVSAARDGSVCLTGAFDQQVRFSEAGLKVYEFAFCEDGNLLIAGGDVALHEVARKLPPIDVLGIDGVWTDLDVAHRAQQVFVMRNERILFRVPAHRGTLEKNSMEAVWTAQPGEVALDFAASSDGALIALIIENRSPRRHRLEILHSGEQEPVAGFPWTSANDFVFSPNGEVLAIVKNNDVLLLEPRSGREIASLAGHRDSVKDLAFSPDGSLLASVSNDRQVICWDVTSRGARWSALAHENRASVLAFHPFLPTLATAGEDGIVRFWWTGRDVPPSASRLVGEFPLEMGGLRTLAFSPDGRHLVVQHGTGALSVLTASAFE